MLFSTVLTPEMKTLDLQKTLGVVKCFPEWVVSLLKDTGGFSLLGLTKGHMLHLEHGF